jgi:prepilin-type N-terminal cleavage/methylation domain-containing protein
MTRRPAFTLIELLVVVVVLVTLVGIVVPLVSHTSSSAQDTVTRSSLVQVRDLIMNHYRVDNGKRLPRPGYVGITQPPNRQDRPQLRYLFVNPGLSTAPGSPETTAAMYDPVAQKGWRGPYLLTATAHYKLDLSRNFTREFGEDGDPTVLDGWGWPLVLIEAAPHAHLRSAGPDSVLFTDDDLILELY